MTATQLHPGTREASTPSRRRSRRLMTVALIIGVAILTATLRPETPMPMHGGEMDGAARGTYRLPDGELLTVFGSARMPATSWAAASPTSQPAALMCSRP